MWNQREAGEKGAAHHSGRDWELSGRYQQSCQATVGGGPTVCWECGHRLPMIGIRQLGVIGEGIIQQMTHLEDSSRKSDVGQKECRDQHGQWRSALRKRG